MAVQLGGKLSGNHITAAQQLIREEFSNLDGLQNPLLSQSDGGFVPIIIGEGVQICYIHNHWVTSSSIYHVVLYDSLYSGKLSDQRRCTD